MASFWVNGIVAQRDKQPYIQLSNDKGMIDQLTISEARAVAQDIILMCSRTEADAMILKFLEDSGIPEAGAAFMQSFRDFRAKLDDEQVERTRD